MKKIIFLILISLIFTNVNTKEINAAITAEGAGTVNSYPEGEAIINEAQKFLGAAYGSLAENCETRTNGDFVQCVIFKAINKTYSNNPRRMMDEVKKIPKNNLKKGDLIFYNFKQDVEIYVGIYVGNKKLIINMPIEGVIYKDMDDYLNAFITYGRP